MMEKQDMTDKLEGIGEEVERGREGIANCKRRAFRVLPLYSGSGAEGINEIRYDVL